MLAMDAGKDQRPKSVVVADRPVGKIAAFTPLAMSCHDLRGEPTAMSNEGVVPAARARDTTADGPADGEGRRRRDGRDGDARRAGRRRDVRRP
jgi:hypothetical protein